MIDWLLGLTQHELNVLQTAAIVIGTGCVPVFGLVLTWFARAIKLSSRNAEEQTRRTERINGTLYSVSVADDTHRMTHELTNLVEPIRAHGRRRNTPTNQVTTYEGDTNE